MASNLAFPEAIIMTDKHAGGEEVASTLNTTLQLQSTNCRSVCYARVRRIDSECGSQINEVILLVEEYLADCLGDRVFVD